jgi:hypothetical protein
VTGRPGLPPNTTGKVRAQVWAFMNWCAYRSPMMRPVHWLAYHLYLKGTNEGADLLDASGFHTKATQVRKASAGRAAK